MGRRGGFLPTRERDHFRRIATRSSAASTQLGRLKSVVAGDRSRLPNSPEPLKLYLSVAKCIKYCTEPIVSVSVTADSMMNASVVLCLLESKTFTPQAVFAATT